MLPSEARQAEQMLFVKGRDWLGNIFEPRVQYTKQKL